jgi:hypothetical protein
MLKALSGGDSGKSNMKIDLWNLPMKPTIRLMSLKARSPRELISCTGSDVRLIEE